MFAGAFAAGASVGGAVLVSAAGTVFASLFAAAGGSAAGAAFAFASPAGAVFASGAAVFAFVLAGDSAGASGLLESTETFPVSAGIERSSAETMNVDAAMIVIFDNTVAVPRGAKAELETLLVKRAPASVLPGCSRTAATRTRHERKKIAYKK